MRTMSDMDRELKTLRKRVRELEGGDGQSAVADLVGTHDAPATKKGLSAHVADDQGSQRVNETLRKHADFSKLQ